MTGVGAKATFKPIVFLVGNLADNARMSATDSIRRFVELSM